MSIKYQDPETLGFVTVKSRPDGDDEIPSHDVAQLPGTVELDISGMRGFLATLAGAIASGNIKAALQAGSNAIGKLAANVGVNIGTVDVLSLPTIAQLASSLGQKPAAQSPSVVLATDQPAISVNVLTGGGGTGPAGTALDPVRTDPIGTTVQPVSLPVTPTANLATIATGPGKLDTIITALGSFLATVAGDTTFLRTYNPALPTGANAIGTVGVTALPALPAGANAIGMVGVTALPGTAEADIAATKVATEATLAALALVPVTLPVTPTANLATIATGPAKLDTIITALGGYLATLAGAVSAARVAVDLATTPTANLATLAGAITTARMAVNVDSTTTGKLDTLHTDLATLATNQGVPSGGPKFGQVAVIVTDTNFASQVLTRGMTITNTDAAIILLVSHAAGPTLAGLTTRVVKPGMSTGFIPCTNANVPIMRSASGTVAACYEGA